MKSSISTVKEEMKKHQLKTLGVDWENYLSYLSSNVQVNWLEQYMQLLNRTIRTKNQAASTVTDELNTNNDLLRKSHSDYNKFKDMESNFHKFSEKFQTQLQHYEEFLKK